MPYKCPSSGLYVTDLDYCDTKGEGSESKRCPVERPIKCTKFNNSFADKDNRIAQLEQSCDLIVMF